MVENRRVGIKSREVYECPGALALILAHADLEGVCLERDVMREKARLEPRFAELVYDGLWHSPLRRALDAFMADTQEHVTGEVRLALDAGRCYVSGRRARRASTTTASPPTTPPTRSATATPRASCACGACRWRRGPAGRARPMTSRTGGEGVQTPEEPPAPPQGAALWQGRFGDAPAEELLDFTESLSFDSRLATDDLAGSRAHVNMLARVGLLTEEERSVDRRRPRPGGGRARRRHVHFLPLDEDIHTAVERRVTELAGPAGAKLHTGRSRNDQVALDLRLYVRREGRVAAAPHDLHAGPAPAGGPGPTPGCLLPGYTHLQRAQPVLLAHHLLAHVWAFVRDVDRLADALDRADSHRWAPAPWPAPPLPLDPGRWPRTSASPAASRTPSTPSPTATSWPSCSSPAPWPRCTSPAWARRSCSGVGGVRLLPAGRRLLDRLLDAAPEEEPRHRRAGRGKAGRLIGDLTGFLATLKGLPLSYNRDLQEDKEPLFDAFDTLAPDVLGRHRDDGDRHVRPRPDAGRRRRPAGRPPTSPRTSCGAAPRSGRPTASWATWSASRSSGGSRSTSW